MWEVQREFGAKATTSSPGPEHTAALTQALNLTKRSLGQQTHATLSARVTAASGVFYPPLLISSSRRLPAISFSGIRMMR